MRARAVVPQKTLSGAKSRLEGVLSAVERAEFSLRLLRTVCAALAAVDSVESVVVMTPDAAVRERVGSWGIRSLVDPHPGLNGALAEIIRQTPPGCAVLVVAADLPLLRPADVAAILAACRPGALVLAPSKEGTGTNAVVVPPGMAFHPAYGTGSRAAHHRGARALGHDVVEVRRPGLAFDVDSEADLLAMRYWGTLA